MFSAVQSFLHRSFVVQSLTNPSERHFLFPPREPHGVIHEALLLHIINFLSISKFHFQKHHSRSIESRGSRSKIPFRATKPRGFTGSRSQRGIPPRPCSAGPLPICLCLNWSILPSSPEPTGPTFLVRVMVRVAPQKTQCLCGLVHWYGCTPLRGTPVAPGLRTLDAGLWTGPKGTQRHPPF